MDQFPPSRSPPPNVIAEFVKLQRALYGWKRETLAGLARVSLSTVERVERGESVRPSSLEKLALALNQPCGAFTTKRVPLSEVEAMTTLVDSLAWMEGTVPFDVAPLRKEAQLRALTDTELVIVTSDLEGEDAARDVDGLREYLDLTGFVRAQDGIVMAKRQRSFRLRRLYKDVLEAARSIERNYKAVCLAGTYEAKSSTPGFNLMRVSVIAVRSRERNPAAANIKRLMANDTIDVQAAMKSYFEGMD